MLRLSEILLFLAPFALLGAWLVFGRRLHRLAWPALAVALLLAALLGTVAVWHGLPRGVAYVPAHIRDGRIVGGHGL